MKKITLEFVESLKQQQRERGMFEECYAEGGLHVKLDAFLEFDDGDLIASTRECPKYPLQWTRRYSDGLVLHTIGTKETAEKHGLPLPE